MITCLLRLLNLLKVDSWKYLLFIASCLYMWICVYLFVGFRYPFGFRVSAGLVLVMDFYPNRFRVSISGFGFGCTETPPDPNPTRCHPYNRLAGSGVDLCWRLLRRKAAMGRSIHRSRVGCAASQKDAVVLPFIFLAEAAAACRRSSVRRRRVNMGWVAEAVRQTRSGATAMGPH